MKKILVIAFSLISIFANAQYVYQPSTDGQGLTRPVGLSNMSTDARSYFHDRQNFTYRPYQSTAEVLSYLSTANVRKGQFVVIVNTGGTLANGVITGGTNAEWWFRDGVADGNLIIKQGGAAVDTTSLSTRINSKQPLLTPGSNITINNGVISAAGGGLPSTTDKLTGTGAPVTPLDVRTALMAEGAAGLKKVRFFGDSITYGTGGTPTDQYNGGIPFMVYLQNLKGFDFFNYGSPGETTDQILVRFYADSANKAYPTVWYSGTNEGVYNWPTTIPKIKAAINSLGHSNYLVVVPAGANTSDFYTGTSNFIAQRQFDSAARAQFPGHVVSVKTWLMAAAVPNSPDTFYTNRGVWPASQGADQVHFNDIGYRIHASAIAAVSDSLLIKKSQERIVTNFTLQSAKDILRSTPITPERMAVGVNVNTDNPYLVDGNGSQRQQPILARGGISVRHPGGTGDGLDLRPGFPDVGGKSSFILSGSNQSIWGSRAEAGLEISNSIRQFKLGSSSLNTEWRQFGDMNVTGNGVFNFLNSKAGMNFSGGGPIWNTGDFVNPRRVLDLQSLGGNQAGGIVLPYMSENAYQGLFNRIPGEIFWNNDLQRPMTAVNHPTINNAHEYIPLAYQRDIKQYLGGAGISVDATTGVITNTLLPPSLKLTGTVISSPQGEFNDADKLPALGQDGNLNTAYQSPPSDYQVGNYLGLDLATAKVVTSFRVRSKNGFELSGAKLQGSNTSSSAGYVDLFTIPTGADLFNFNQYTVSGAGPYRYIRLLQPNGSYLFGIIELEFYGYQSAPAPDVFATQKNTFTTTNVFTDTVVIKAPAVAAFTDSALVRDPITSALSMRKVNNSGGGSNLPAANGSTNGYLTSLDWRRFDSSYSRIISINDSTIGFRRGNGTVDSVQISGFVSSGGSSGPETDPVYSAASANIARVNASNTFTQSQTFNAFLNIFGGLGAHETYTTTYTFGNAAIFKSNSNAVTRLSMNDGGTGNIIVNNAAGAEVARLSGDNGNLDLERGAELHLNDNANTVNNIVLKGSDGTIKASSLAGNGNRMVIVGPTGIMSTQTIPTSGSGSTGSFTLRNARIGDTTTKKLNDSTLIFKGLQIVGGVGVTVAKNHTDTTNNYTINVTGSESSGEDINEVNNNYTVSLANGKLQNLEWPSAFDPAGKVITFPTGSDAQGLTIYFRNYANTSISTNLPYFRTTSISTTGTGIIPAQSMVKIIFKRGSTEYWMMTFPTAAQP